jgi:hypothetical protein
VIPFVRKDKVTADKVSLSLCCNAYYLTMVRETDEMTNLTFVYRNATKIFGIVFVLMHFYLHQFQLSG